MTEARASTTALGVASLRAAHLLLDDRPPILADTVAIRLLGDGAEAAIREHRDRFFTPGSLGLRSHVLLRSRFAEDTLLAAVARGIDQYLVLGAGLDTFAHRQPAATREVTIVEVDLLATQATKRQRLADAGIADPPNLRYVAADLTDAALLDHLAAAGVDIRRPAVATLLGVTVYLPPDAVRRLHATLGTLAAGSEVVMTFAQPPASGRPDRLADAAAAAGEPWLTRTTPAALVDELRDAGFGEAAILDPADAAQRYFRGRTDGLFPSPRANLLRATVGRRTGPAAVPVSDSDGR
jgi:methyltransferase (TIGR00027 family)